MTRSAFDPDSWLIAWKRVGGVMVHGTAVFLVTDLAGNWQQQRRLMGRLDGVHGRREAVYGAALRREAVL